MHDGPRSHKAHMTGENIDQLRQLVETIAPKPTSYARHPRDRGDLLSLSSSLAFDLTNKKRAMLSS